MTAFIIELEIASTVGGDVTAYAGQIRLLGPARVAGDVLAHVDNEGDLRVSPGASVGGSVRTELREQRPEADSEYTTFGYYAGQAVRLGAAFVTGLIVLWLVPSLRRISVDTAGESVTAAGVGLVTAVAVPIIALMTAITVIGLPVALLGFALWIAGLYFAKILFGHFLGRKLFARAGRQPHFALALLVGLVLVLIAVNIPYAGPVLNFLLTITGLGMLMIYVWGRLQER